MQKYELPTYDHGHAENPHRELRVQTFLSVRTPTAPNGHPNICRLLEYGMFESTIPCVSVCVRARVWECERTWEYRCMVCVYNFVSTSILFSSAPCTYLFLTLLFNVQMQGETPHGCTRSWSTFRVQPRKPVPCSGKVL